MSATMARTKDVVSSVEGQECLMLTTAKNAPFKKKIEMDALRLSTLAAPRRTCSTKERSTASRRGDVIS